MENQAKGLEEQTNLIESLVKDAGEYAKTSLELYQLKGVSKASEIISNVAARLGVMVVMLIFLIILNIGVALWLGELLGKTYYGFFVVAGFYFIIGLILFFARNQLIKQPVSKSIVEQMLK